MKRIALLILTAALVALVTCAAHASPEDTLVRDGRGISRAIHATVMLQTPEGRTFCSGTVVKDTGLILTAEHCISDWTPADRVRSIYGLHSAAVIFFSVAQDVAFIKLNGFEVSRKDGVPIARSAPRMGDTIYALGHAMGDSHPFTMTKGIVSHSKRAGHFYLGEHHDANIWMQGDAALIGGMSGGGTYNAKFQLVGLNQFVMLARTHCTFPPCPAQDSPVYGYAHHSQITRLLILALNQ